MQVRSDWTTELREIRNAVHELDGRLAQILWNLDQKSGVRPDSDVQSAAVEFDELGES